VLLLNLCIALILAYVVFLAGIDSVENQVMVLNFTIKDATMYGNHIS